MSVLSLLSSVFVNGQGQPTWLWVVLSLLLFAFHVWSDRPHPGTAIRRGKAFPAVPDPALPDEDLDEAGVRSDPRTPVRIHLWPVDETADAATRSGW